jgi:phosphoglycerol geranylgeranyltransferase
MNLSKIINTNRKAQLVVLVDPDKFNPKLVDLAAKSKIAFFLVGGSELKKNNISKVVAQIKRKSKKPVLIFPGNEKQICKNADGLLLLSLISGRNAEFLIGKHVKAVPAIKKNRLKSLPVGYILIDGDRTSATEKVTNTKAISTSKLATDTAIAGELLGLKAIYLEAGSGAKTQVNSNIIKSVKRNINIPLFVGGGIDSAAKAKLAIKAGANFVVVGNALEKNLYLLSEIEKAF